MLAEQNARTFLEKQGLIFVEKNFRIKRGEIDLIMWDKNYLVFIEVKLRSKQTHGSSLDVISKAKRAHIIHAANIYLMKHKLYNTTFCRFDVVGIAPHKEVPNTREFTWIKDAFRVE